MAWYRLVYECDRFGEDKTVEFEAKNAAGALQHAQREALGRRAQLYEGRELLCRLERVDPVGGNLWVVAAGDAAD